MKKVLLILLFFITINCSLYAKINFNQSSISFDIGILQDLILLKTKSYQINGMLKIKVSDTFYLSFPINYTFSNNGANKASMIDGGLDLIAYPFEKLGFFAGMSLLKIGYQLGKTNLDNKIFALNELITGWTFKIKKLLIETSVSIRDPSKGFTDEYGTIKGVFPCYNTMRIHLLVGYQFI